jgi:tetratricopeptide (TPR) repeat protein
VRRALEAAAQDRPLVVVFDDIHWGEETFLDLLDHIADLSRGAPILLLCIARPELLDDRPGWGGGKLNATTALLQPLTAEESSTLLDALDDEAVDDHLRSRIIESSGGNPLFVEEMLALARDGGDIRAPSTIQALLQARLDRLGAAERGVIERGAVEGELFHRGAVQELANGAGESLDADLVGLVRKELIRPERGTLHNDDAYRFRHLLIRDVAYDGLPKETRADLHLRFAGWLSSHTELVEIDEIMGYHLEQAARYRRELGRPDAELELRCGLLLATAGNKAAGRGDLPAADNLLARSLALVPLDDPRRRTILLERIAALENSGDAQEVLAMAAELEGSSAADTRMHGRVTRLQLGVRLDPTSVFDEVQPAAREALDLFNALGDHHGVARAWYLLFWFDWLQSRARPALASLEHAIEHAERAGSHALAASASVYLLGPLLNGPVRAMEVRARIEPIKARSGPIAASSVLRLEAHLARLDGRLDDAVELNDQANTIDVELGRGVMLVIMRQWSVEVLILQGRIAETLEIMREAVAKLEAMGETSFLSTSLVRLAHVLYLDGQPEEAERLAIEGEAIGAEEDVINFAWGRAIRAMILADRGEFEEAETLAEQAASHAYRTDFAWAHALVHEARGHVLATAGRTDEARSELARTIELYESYDNTFEAARARDLLIQL